MIVENGIRYERTYSNELKVMGFIAGYTTDILEIPETVYGDKVIAIAPDAFAKEKYIKTVYMPETIEIIAEFAFADCPNLERVELTTVIDFEERIDLLISEHAFENCHRLKDFIGNGRVVRLESYAFDKCYSLEKLDLRIQEVEEFAFYHCYVLRELTFNELAMLRKDCISGLVINRLKFNGDAIIDSDVLISIKSNNTKIYCVKGSDLEDLAYEGYHVELIDNRGWFSI